MRKQCVIKLYISDYEHRWKEGRMIGYNEEKREKDIEKVYHSVISGNISKSFQQYYKDMRTRIADVMAGKYIASLNDSEFLQLLQDEKLISPEQVQSLTRKYRDIEHLLDEAYIQSNWKTIASIQEKTTEEEKEGIEGEVK